jgi:nitrite reductase/ring-hydroxylating ferredoxin subunit
MPHRPIDGAPVPAAARAVEASCCATRRQVLRAAGFTALAPASGGVLAGCGPEPTREATVADDGTLSVAAADTPVGGATYYGGAEVVVTQPTEGDYRAFDATCPHQGCATSSFDDGVLVCPCHGSQFDPSSGEVVRGPAETGLTARTAILDGTDVVISG